MKKIDNIPYDKTIGVDGLGDLFLPDNADNAPAALLIHGGGWRAMTKESLTPVALALVKAGHAVFSINYRLIDTAPWPACGDDCLKAAEFLLNAGHPEMHRLNLRQISVVGASAGGHLSMMTGLRMSPEKVNAIMSISGVSDLALRSKQFSLKRKDPAFWQTFSGGEVSEDFLKKASPHYYVEKTSPPLCCIHSINDQLVLPEHAEIMKKVYDNFGVKCDLILFDGPGKSHGLFEDGHGELALSDRVLLPIVQNAIMDYFLNKEN